MLPIDGILANERRVIYAVPPNARATITSIEVCNVSGAPQTFTLYCNVSGQPVPITALGTFLEAGHKGEDTIIRTLRGGMFIEGEASGGITFIICGEEA